MGIDVSPDWWQSLFDEIYLVTDARSVCDEEVTRREVDVFCELLSLRPSDRILDLCGGQGRHSLELCGRGYGECTVLDYSEVLLEHGRAAAAALDSRVEFVQGDASDTGLPGGGFDHVLLLGNSIGYRADDGGDLRILEEARRLLRPGGRLLVDVTDGARVRETFSPNAWHEIEEDIVVCRQRELDGDRVRAREMVISKEEGLVRDRSYAIRIYNPAVLEEVVRRAGFDIVDLRRGFSPRDGDGDYGFMSHRLLVTAEKREV
jgi:D-alanine-D-alanine ligase